MKEPGAEGVAIHGGPESCVDLCKEIGEALTGVCTGAVWSREINHIGVPTLSIEAEGHALYTANARWTGTPRGRRPAARAELFRARTGRSRVHRSMARPVALGRPQAAIQ